MVQALDNETCTKHKFVKLYEAMCVSIDIKMMQE